MRTESALIIWVPEILNKQEKVVVILFDILIENLVDIYLNRAVRRLNRYLEAPETTKHKLHMTWSCT